MDRVSFGNRHHSAARGVGLSRPAAATRFRGYMGAAEKIEFYKPGLQWLEGDRLTLEFKVAENGPLQTVPMAWDEETATWRMPANSHLRISNTDNPVYYRFHHSKPDQSGVRLDNSYGDFHRNFNLIPQGAPVNPSSLGNSLLVLRDTIQPEERLAELDVQRRNGDFTKAMRNPFNRFTPNGGAPAANNGIRPFIRKFGLDVLQDCPVIGGDQLSSHGYWTNTLWQLQGMMGGETGWAKIALDNLHDGVRWRFDGAFVNEGLNGVHYLANQLYGKASPYLGYIDYGKVGSFPDAPLKIGILPFKVVPGQGEVPVWEGHSIRVRDKLENIVKLDGPVPARNGPFWIESYDPRRENYDGTPVKSGKYVDFTSQDSMQSYRFLVYGSELRSVWNQLSEASRRGGTALQETAQTAFKNLHYDTRSKDNSGKKWDGQVDVNKINIENPEVQRYLQDGAAYWADKQDRLYTGHVAQALTQYCQKNDQNPWHDKNQLYQAVRGITKDNHEDNTASYKVMPPLDRRQLDSMHSEPVDPVTPESIQAALEKYRREKAAQTLPAAQLLRKKLSKNFGLPALPAPKLMQIHLHNPKLADLLDKAEPRFVVALFKRLFSWIDRIFKKSRPIEKAYTWLVERSWLRRKSFLDHLEARLEQSLSESLKARLKDPVLAHLAYEALGRHVLLTLLTGRTNLPTDEKGLAKAYENVLEQVGEMTPDQAAVMLSGYLTKQLKTLDMAQVNSALERALQGITPEAAVVARHVLHQRNFVLHWRIDALKDFGDIDAVRAGTKTLESQIDVAAKTIRGIVNKLREVTPGANIIAEVTDLWGLTGFDKGREMSLTHRLMQGLDGMPNYNYIYATGGKMVNTNPMPDHQMQLDAAGLVANLREMVYSMPLNQVLSYQNMFANQDKSTVLWSFACFPLLSQYDQFPQKAGILFDGGWGVLPQALNELRFRRHRLGDLVQNVPEGLVDWSIGALMAFAKEPKTQEFFRTNHPDIYTFLMSYDQRGTQQQRICTPELKARFADLLFERFFQAYPDEHSKDFGQHSETLKKALKTLMTEPGEYKAARGRIGNAFESLMAEEGKNLPQAFGVSQATKQTNQVKALLSKVAPHFNGCLFDLQQQYPGQWLGYQQLNHLILMALQASLKKAGVAVDKVDAAILDKAEQAIYNASLMPALEQFKRAAALLVAIPGDPTFYMPDLFGQAGGAYLRVLTYLGNRELIRHDWAASNPVIQKFVDDMANILNIRKNNPVLNNGEVLFPYEPGNPALHAHNVLPVVRANSQDQMISLINFGRPQKAEDIWWQYHKLDHTGDNEYMQRIKGRAPEIESQERWVRNYRLNVGALGIPKWTVFESVDTERGQERQFFIVNENYDVVRYNPETMTHQDEQGIDIHIARNLLRVSPERLSKGLYR